MATNGASNKVEKLMDVLSDLKAQAMEAERSGDLELFAVYRRLVGVMSPIVQRAYAAEEQKARSELYQKHRAMRKASSANGKSPS